LLARHRLPKSRAWLSNVGNTLADVNLAPAVRHGCRSAGHACPLGSSTAAASSVRPNEGLKARPHAVNLVTLARKRFIAHF